MRIIGGRWRGRTLQAPRGRDTRPTSDRVREAVFSSIYSLAGGLEGCSVLDLYAGSGALGLEALSRGAGRCTFVDADGRALTAISANVRSLGIDTLQVRLIQAKVNAGLADRLRCLGVSLLLADPPYRIDQSEFREALEALASSGALAQGALVVYEHSSRVQPPWPHGYAPGPDKRYGDTHVSFATYEGEGRT